MFQVQSIGNQYKPSFETQIDHIIESLKSPNHNQQSHIDKLIESLKSPGRPASPLRIPTQQQYFPDTGIQATSHGFFTTTSRPTTMQFTTTHKTPTNYPLFQFHNKYADQIRTGMYPATQRPKDRYPGLMTAQDYPSLVTKRPKHRLSTKVTEPTSYTTKRTNYYLAPNKVVTWRPQKPSLPEKSNGNQFVGGVTNLVSNIAVYEEKYRPPSQNTNYITGDNVIPEMSGSDFSSSYPDDNYPDYGLIEYLDYIEGSNVISEMSQKTTTKRPSITFFPAPTPQPTQPTRPTYKPQHHFVSPAPNQPPNKSDPTRFPTPTPRPTKPTRPPYKPQNHFVLPIPNQPVNTANPTYRPQHLFPAPSPNIPAINQVFTYPPYTTSSPFNPTAKPSYKPIYTLLPFSPTKSPANLQPTTSHPTVRPTQSYRPQFNPLFTSPNDNISSASTDFTSSLPPTYPSGPFSYKPTYRPGFQFTTPNTAFFTPQLSTHSTPKSPYKPTFKPAVLATFAPQISFSSPKPFSNTSTTSTVLTPYPFVTYPFPILPDFDPTNKPVEFIDGIQTPTSTPLYQTLPSTSPATTAATTKPTTITTTTPYPDVVTIPGLPGVAIPSTFGAWTEYFNAAIRELFGLFRSALLYGQSAEGQEATEDMGALTAVVGLPLVTGALSLLGAGPAAVIAVAWLLPVASLLLLPGLAG